MNDLFDKAFKKHTSGIEDHQFRHYNNSMGCMIYSKKHYKDEMLKRGMVPYEECERLAQEWDKTHAQQPYDTITAKAECIIKSLKMTADSQGNIKLGSRAIEALIELGAIKPRSEYAPDGIEMKGGFNEKGEGTIKDYVKR